MVGLPSFQIDQYPYQIFQSTEGIGLLEHRFDSAVFFYVTSALPFMAEIETCAENRLSLSFGNVGK